jgi:hypothetical protein
MTILKTTNKVCKIIQKSIIKEKTQKLFDELIASRREVSLGSIASVLNRQFLGYLIANQEAHQQRQRLNPHLPPDIHLLSSEEFNILAEAHKFLLRVNTSIGSLENLLPNAQSSISPYSDYDYNLPDSSHTEFISEEMDKALDELQIQFKNHPSLEVIQNCINNLSGTRNIKEEEFIKSVLNYREQIIKHSLFNRTGDLESELFNRRDTSQFYIGRLIRSLIVLRDSISNIDQFLYQAIRYEKPIILNRDNVFEYEGMKQSWVGKIIYLRVQPIGEEAYSRPGDFIRVSLKLEDSLKDGFYRIEQINASYSNDFGSSIRFGLRPIDENMVCYPQLLIS